jgi:GcrA cell cycle regulator
MNANTSRWTDDLREKVKHLWATHSATQISELLWDQEGILFTRNAIMGLLHRAKLTSKDKSEDHVQSRHNGHSRPRIRIVSVNSNSHQKRIVRDYVTPELAKLRCAGIEPRHLSLLDLEPSDCRYPYGDGPITFCGHAKQDGSSYCSSHFHLTRGTGTSSERAATQVSKRMESAA